MSIVRLSVTIVSADVILAGPIAIVAVGWSASVYEKKHLSAIHVYLPSASRLGICYGMQLASQALGSERSKATPFARVSSFRLQIKSMEKLFAGFPHEIECG